VDDGRAAGTGGSCGGTGWGGGLICRYLDILLAIAAFWVGGVVCGCVGGGAGIDCLAVFLRYLANFWGAGLTCTSVGTSAVMARGGQLRSQLRLKRE
jgi:hypothetical protein